MNAEVLPTVFEDSLSLRASNLRFRGVGNPYAFLDGIGIVPIKEFLFRGANIIDIADVLNIPLTLIHNWIEAKNLRPDIEEASVVSAEGYIYQGEKMLRAATNKFELDKAKTMLEHGRFMASKKNKKVYGNQVDMAAGAAAVTYIFNVGATPAKLTALPADINPIHSTIDAEFVDVSAVRFSLAEEFGIDLGPAPAHLEPEPLVLPDPPAPIPDMLEADKPVLQTTKPLSREIKAREGLLKTAPTAQFSEKDRWSL